MPLNPCFATDKEPIIKEISSEPIDAIASAIACGSAIERINKRAAAVMSQDNSSNRGRPHGMQFLIFEPYLLIINPAKSGTERDMSSLFNFLKLAPLRKQMSTAIYSLGCAALLFAGSALGETVTNESAEAAGPRISIGQAAILGTIEGLTEYLPVSSTGHLILTADAMGLGGYAHDENGEPIKGPLGPIMEPAPAINAFNIVIQIGAILAVVGIYFKRICEMGNGLIGRDPNGKKLLINLIAAFMPAAVFGLLFDDMIEQYLFSPLTVGIALAVGGVVMILATKFYKRGKTHQTDVHTLTLRAAIIIGFVQCLAMWPGTSRSMVTILAGLGVGLSMTAAAEFSFLLALPTLTAATLYKMVTQWDALAASAGAGALIVGIVISTIVAGISVKFLLKYLTRHGLMPFGIYRILLAVGVIYHFTR